MRNQKANHLIHEKSPYLLQHAYNPVDWHPWSQETFKKAQAEDKPIFLSIGYSTCHWCHVMEQESFEDEEVAQLLNEHFISIKVDREERPDVDAIYMAACQAFTGQGGWPLTIFMTPQQKPFFAGTYFPKGNRYGAMGLISLLYAVIKGWNEDKEALISTGEEVVNLLHRDVSRASQLSEHLLEQAVKMYQKSFDKNYGGFGTAPKFPSPHNLMFLLRYAQAKQDALALAMVETTLQQLYRGGIFDHIGFGFSRYSTDEKWLVPHFEKMLYDNALLLMTYAQAYQITKNNLYKTVAEKIITYVLRELTDENGGFYCAQDADSEGEEGKYYTFTSLEIKGVLGEQDAEVFNKHFDITEQGNFEGKNIPNLIKNNEFTIKNEEIESMRNKLYQYRLSRTKLHKDDKTLTSWNALMIAAFAEAYRVFGNGDYLYTAESAINFLEQKLIDKNGRLCVRYRDGETAGKGNLEDYAFTIWAYLTLYQASFNANYLKKAKTLAQEMITLFYDKENAGFFLYGNDAEQLIHRPKEAYDGAIPSGNSVAGYILLLLEKLTADKEFREKAQKQMEFLASKISEYPTAYSFAMIAAQQALYPSKEIICVLKDQSEINRIKTVLNSSFLPNVTVLMKYGTELDEIAPYTKDYSLKDNETTFYVCENHTCSAPFHDIEALYKQL